ncbi:MAG: hypothetical protein ACLRSW_00445 [Christensenellaceae bacterium]
MKGRRRVISAVLLALLLSAGACGGAAEIGGFSSADRLSEETENGSRDETDSFESTDGKAGLFPKRKIPRSGFFRILLKKSPGRIVRRSSGILFCISIVLFPWRIRFIGPNRAKRPSGQRGKCFYQTQ